MIKINRVIKKQKKYTYEKLKSDLYFLKYIYPYFEIRSIGKSTLDEDIIYIKLGKGRKKLFINASHHANEWLTSLIIMMFIEKYLYLYRTKQNFKGFNIRKLWENVSTYVVPMVNPDGVDLCLEDKRIINKEAYREIWGNHIKELKKWKANIRGVDLNLNYPAGWNKAVYNKIRKGIYIPGPRDYPGPNAVSEIETKDMIEFSKLMNFDITISLHSQGKEIYWNYLGYSVKKAYEIGKRFERVSRI